MFSKIDNNTYAVGGLCIALICSIFYGTENLSLAIGGGLVGFITGSKVN